MLRPGPDRRSPITLAMVAYHKADVIGLVIESAARGTVVPDLIVVADDGSTDGTPDAAVEAGRRVGIPCRVLRHPRVGTYRIQAMRNSAAAAALDGVILLSDSDCIMGRFTLEAHLAIHAKFDDAIGTGTRFEYLEGTGGDFTSMYSTLEFSHCPVANYIVPYGANMSFTKRMWHRLDGFDRAYDGNYGFEDHEFLYRAQLAGAVTYSDPAAFLFHCPHDTVFGHRDPAVNANQFNRCFHRNYGHEQWMFLREVVVPGYWRGERKETLIGPERLQLDRWGAPPGYHPPLHLTLVESLEPMAAAVRTFVASGSEPDRQALVRLLQSVAHDRLLAHSPADVLLGNLRWVVNTFDMSSPKRRSDLFHWLDRWLRWQQGIEAGSAQAVHSTRAQSATVGSSN